MNRPFIEALKERLAQPLPGRPHQEKMAVLARRALMDAPADARLACVLILLVEKKGIWHVVLTERATRAGRDKHSGQISFPGGRLEPNETLEMCALRETAEEIGVQPHQVTMLGALTDLYIPVSHFKVFPFVAVAHTPPQYVPEIAEVAAILEVPLPELSDVNNHHTTTIEAGGTVLKGVPCIMAAGKIIWGATAMILSEFLNLTERLSEAGEN